MIRASIRIGAMAMFGLASAIPGASQDMMHHVELTSPEMASAEMTRADVEAAIASATSLKPADLAGKKLSGLDLSSLDLSGAILRGARLKQTNLSYATKNQAERCKTRPGGSRSSLARGGRSQSSEPHTRQHFCRANATCNARWSRSLGRAHHRRSNRGKAGGHRAHGRQPRRRHEESVHGADARDTEIQQSRAGDPARCGSVARRPRIRIAPGCGSHQCLAAWRGLGRRNARPRHA